MEEIPRFKPSLKRFSESNLPIRWLDYVANGAHFVTFTAHIGQKIYTVKIFRRFDTYDFAHMLRTSEPPDIYLEPFIKECRAYGRIHEIEQIDSTINDYVTHCYGFFFLKEEDKRLLYDQFQIDLNDFDEQGCIRALIKEFLPPRPPIIVNLSNIWEGILLLNGYGIYNLGVHENNYRDGKLVELDSSETTPFQFMPPKMVDQCMYNSLRAYINEASEGREQCPIRGLYSLPPELLFMIVGIQYEHCIRIYPRNQRRCPSHECGPGSPLNRSTRKMMSSSPAALWELMHSTRRLREIFRPIYLGKVQHFICANHFELYKASPFNTENRPPIVIGVNLSSSVQLLSLLRSRNTLLNLMPSKEKDQLSSKEAYMETVFVTLAKNHSASWMLSLMEGAKNMELIEGDIYLYLDEDKYRALPSTQFVQDIQQLRSHIQTAVWVNLLMANQNGNQSWNEVIEWDLMVDREWKGQKNCIVPTTKFIQRFIAGKCGLWEILRTDHLRSGVVFPLYVRVYPRAFDNNTTMSFIYPYETDLSSDQRQKRM